MRPRRRLRSPHELSDALTHGSTEAVCLQMPGEFTGERGVACQPSGVDCLGGPVGGVFEFPLKSGLANGASVLPGMHSAIYRKNGCW